MMKLLTEATVNPLSVTATWLSSAPAGTVGVVTSCTKAALMVVGLLLYMRLSYNLFNACLTRSVK